MSTGLSLGARLAQLTPPPKGAPPARARIDLLIEPQASPFGPLHLLEHPAIPVPPVEARCLEALALSPRPLDVSRPLYFDTETTGLSGGTGTLAFLLGIAEVRQGHVFITQVHLPAPGQERPMLEWLAGRIEASTLLISFNGRSFDWPLLKSRYVMNRLRPPPERPHVDLLHCARRVFRHQLPEFKLSALERRVLDVHRQCDIEGALIPAVWFDYLRTGRVAALAQVLTHNERDVRSMVDLVAWLVAAWEERHPVLPAAALGLASVAVRHGDDARALRFLERAIQGSVAQTAWSLKAEIHRRSGDYRRSAEALQRALVGSKSPASLHLRLAKLYEHRLDDMDAARRHAELCGPAEDVSSHTARRKRLLRP